MTYVRVHNVHRLGRRSTLDSGSAIISRPTPADCIPAVAFKPSKPRICTSRTAGTSPSYPFMPVRCHLVFCLCMRGAAACSSALKISTVSKNTNQSAKPLWLVFSLSNLWIIVSSFVTLPSSQNQPLSAVVKGCQYILLAHLLHIACSFTLPQTRCVCRKSAECRRPYSSKDIGWNAGFPSSASPLLHHLITKTIHKKSAPFLQRDRPVFLLQKRYTAPASI